MPVHRFVGRAREVAAICALLRDPDVRLLAACPSLTILVTSRVVLRRRDGSDWYLAIALVSLSEVERCAGDDAHGASWEAGRALPADEAVAEALAHTF